MLNHIYSKFTVIAVGALLVLPVLSTLSGNISADVAAPAAPHVEVVEKSNGDVDVTFVDASYQGFPNNYRVYINKVVGNSSTNSVDKNVTEDEICTIVSSYSSGNMNLLTCTYTVGPNDLSDGEYAVTIGNVGTTNTNWSESVRFNINSVTDLNVDNQKVSWSEITQNEWYQIYISDTDTGKIFLNKWFTSAELECVANSECEYAYNLNSMPFGNYSLWIRAWNADTSYGNWSSEENFTFGKTKMEVNTLEEINSDSTDSNLKLEWTSTNQSEWYRVYVIDTQGGIYDKWHKSIDVCVADDLENNLDECNIEVALTEADTYTVWVQTWKSDGSGLWSDEFVFEKTGSTIPVSYPAE